MFGAQVGTGAKPKSLREQRLAISARNKAEKEKLAAKTAEKASRAKKKAVIGFACDPNDAIVTEEAGKATVEVGPIVRDAPPTQCAADLSSWNAQVFGGGYEMKGCTFSSTSDCGNHYHELYDFFSSACVHSNCPADGLVGGGF